MVPKQMEDIARVFEKGQAKCYQNYRSLFEVVSSFYEIPRFYLSIKIEKLLLVFRKAERRITFKVTKDHQKALAQGSRYHSS